MKSPATYTPIRCAVKPYDCAHCGAVIEPAEDFYVFTCADGTETEIVCEPCHDDDVRGIASRGITMDELEEQEDSEERATDGRQQALHLLQNAAEYLSHLIENYNASPSLYGWDRNEAVALESSLVILRNAYRKARE